MISTRQIYWTAGFMEGDGSFTFSKAGNLAVTAGQVQRWPLEKLQGLYGGSIYEKKIDTRHNSQQAYVWTLTGSAAAGIMMTLYSLMTEKRKEQIRKALDGWKQKRPHKFRTHCPQGHEYSPENTYVHRGSRKCLACQRRRDLERTKKWRSR